MNWERDEWRSARYDDDTPVRRFAGGIEIVGDPSDAEDDFRELADWPIWYATGKED